MASDGGCKSISFPALGTGVLEYPPDSVARWMIEACCDYCNAAPTTSINKVNIVIYSKDQQTQKVGSCFSEYCG